MARLVFPDEGSRLVYSGGASNLYGVAGATVTVYSDAAGTTLANITTYPGGVAIASSTLTVDAYSRIPLFNGPDGADMVYVSVDDGPVTAVYARADDRFDSLGTAAYRSVGTGAGTVAAGDAPVAAATRAKAVSARNAPVMCRLKQTGAQTITTGTSTPVAINFASEDFDTDALHSNATNNSRITPVLAGGMTELWEFSGCVEMAAATAGDVAVFIVRNGSSNVAYNFAPSRQTSTTAVNVLCTVEVTAGDYFELGVRHTTGADRATATTQTYFAGRRLGTRIGEGGSLLFDAAVPYKATTAFSTVINPGTVSVVDDPVNGAKRQVLKFSVTESDLSGGYPRAQAQSASTLAAGSLYYVGWGLYLPSDFPVIPADGWMVHHEIYGPPFNSTGPTVMWILNEKFSYTRNATYSGDEPWSMPIVRGAWVDFVMAVRLSADPAIGTVQLWVNAGSGYVQQNLAGNTTLTMATIDASNNGGNNFSSLKQSRKLGMFPNLTTVTYTTGQRVGTTFAAVDPCSYSLPPA